MRTIKVDAAIAETLEVRAAARGVSVSDLVAEFIARDEAPLAIDADQIAELDRRWAAVETGSAVVPHDEVVHWLQTWGTPAFKPWSER